MQRLTGRWGATVHTLLTNAIALMGTTVVTAGLGFAYWWIAAHLFVPDAIGLASATISAMTLLGTIATLGLGTLLIGELPRQPERQAELIITALVLAAVAGTGLGLLFALIAPLIAVDFQALTRSLRATALFALGVGLTTVTLVVDQAMIGLLRGSVQFWRNGIFAVAKLILLILLGMWLADGSGLMIYATWLAGNLISLLYLLGIVAKRRVKVRLQWPQWSLLRQLSQATMGHHLLNLALQLSGLGMPLVVTALLSTTLNASFYMAWLLLTLVFAVPYSLTIVLFAVGMADPKAFAAKVRFTLGLAAVIGLLANGVIWLGADMIMGLFGSSYAEQAAGALRLLGLAVFPLIIKDHFVAIRRVREQIVGTGLIITLAGLFELLVAGVGAQMGGLEGLAIGWLIALSIEALFLLRTVFGVVFLKVRSTLRQPESIVMTKLSESPRLSVIINNYNYGRFLSAAIDSALAQTYTNIEVIVVDDGSTDNSRTVIESYADRIVPIFQPNGGQASALNTGFAHSCGEVVIFLDADDMLLPSIGQRVVAAFQEDHELARIQYRMEVVDLHGNCTGIIKPHRHMSLPNGDLRQNVLSFPEDMAWLPTSGNAFSRTVLQRIFPIPIHEYRILADFYLIHIATLFGFVATLNDLGAYYRVHGNNNYESTVLNLGQVRATFLKWHITHYYIRTFAEALDLRIFSANSEEPYSVAYLANRMISLKLDPTAHPLAHDRLGRLFWLSLPVIARRFDVSWWFKCLYGLWFMTLVVAPRPGAMWLTERWLFPEKRPYMNKILTALRPIR